MRTGNLLIYSAAAHSCINPNAEEQAKVFSENLAAELETAWAGEPELSLAQQSHCATVYNRVLRLSEWRESHSMDPRSNEVALN